MHAQGHPSMNPSRLFIGNAQLTADRHAWPVRPIDINTTLSSGYGTLGEYVPFYFGPRSPMLYVITKAKQGPKRPQADIVYVGCKFLTVANSGTQFAFTDGHAKMKVTGFYTQPQNLDKLNWDVIYSPVWNNTEQEFDRTRQKQAEFLVHSYVPPEWIDVVVVHDNNVCTFAQGLIQAANHRATVRVNPTHAFDNCGFYYP
jgi:hypothetical protein